MLAHETRDSVQAYCERYTTGQIHASQRAISKPGGSNQERLHSVAGAQVDHRHLRSTFLGGLESKDPCGKPRPLVACAATAGTSSIRSTWSCARAHRTVDSTAAAISYNDQLANRHPPGSRRA
jgi:hypothetical protein